MQDKLDEMVFAEFINEMEMINNYEYSAKSQRRKRYKKQAKYKAKLAKKCQQFHVWHNHMWKEDERIAKFEFVTREKPYVKKYYLSANSKRYKSYQKAANRKVRHTTEAYNGCLYKHLYEYAWSIG